MRNCNTDLISLFEAVAVKYVKLLNSLCNDGVAMMTETKRSPNIGSTRNIWRSSWFGVDHIKHVVEVLFIVFIIVV